MYNIYSIHANKVSKDTKKIIKYNVDGITNKDIKWHSIFLKVAKVLSEGSHCVSHKVGAVLVKNNRIISTGINGTPAGTINCDEVFNSKSFDKDEHHEWSNLHELHAEVNMLLIAAKEGISVKDTILYVTISPCIHCAKAIIAAGIKEVYFSEIYNSDINGLIFLRENGVELYLIEEN